MKIYLVKRTDTIGWDEFDGFICSAKDEEEARHTVPIFESMSKVDEQQCEYCWISKDKINSLEVIEIGEANTEERVVFLSSFNAG